MKLIELFQILPELFEDNAFIGDQRFDQDAPSFDGVYARPVGDFNGSEIWGSRYYGKDVDVYGILGTDRKTPIAYIALEKSSEGYLLRRAWVDKVSRGKKLTLTLLNFVISKCKEHVTVTSDEKTSSSSREFFKRLIALPPQTRHFTVKFVDGDTEIKDPDINKILGQGSKNSIKIVMEGVDHGLRLFETGSRRLYGFQWY